VLITNKILVNVLVIDNFKVNIRKRQLFKIWKILIIITQGYIPLYCV